MTATIAGVPEKVSHADYAALVTSLGFAMEDLLQLSFHPSSIEATVVARNTAGQLLTNGGEIATHKLSIPVED